MVTRTHCRSKGPRRERRYLAAGAACTLALLAQMAAPAFAGPREQAKRIYDRIAGVPPAPAVLDQMAAKAAANDLVGAAAIATDAPTFYSVTLKNLVTPWTNRDQTVFAPLNDYTATVIGMVRDDPLKHQMEHFGAVVRGEAQPLVSARDGLKKPACYRSHRRSRA